ncbi:MAG TPA: hypothetical protein VGW77_29490 [Candidatus Binatia bacterium]|jgi:hypothetical protein|nr:hypothetical protein [Candidatus Binatia bacterium]
MKRIGPIVSAMVFVGALAGSAIAAADGVLVKEEGGENYCHMKFPAMRQRTLASDSPQLKRSDTGDVIDFYGACDESPTGKDQVISQRQEEQFRFGREYEDGD